MTYRYTGPVADLYRELNNPWMRAKEVAKHLDQTPEQVRARLSHNVWMGIMEKRYQRPKMEYRFVEGALEKPDRYRDQQQERRARAAAPYIYELEQAGYEDAASFLRDKAGAL
jgi:hypothetical protein